MSDGNQPADLPPGAWREVEWGVRYEHPLGAHTTLVCDEEAARHHAAATPAKDQVITLVHREVTYGPWEDAR